MEGPWKFYAHQYNSFKIKEIETIKFLVETFIMYSRAESMSDFFIS